MKDIEKIKLNLRKNLEKIIYSRITNEELGDLDEFANNVGMTRSAAIRFLITEGLKKA